MSRYDRSIGVVRRARKLVSSKMPPKQVERLTGYFNHKDGVSQLKAGTKFGISQSYLNKLLKSTRHGGVVPTEN